MAVYEQSQMFAATNNMDQSETFCIATATDEFPVLIHPKSATCLLNIVADHSHSCPYDPWLDYCNVFYMELPLKTFGSFSRLNFS